MFKQRLLLMLVVAMLLSSAVCSYAQTVAPASQQDEFIATLKSSEASRKQKNDACRHLSLIATKKAIPALAALLADAELNHMARYALETIPDKAVDDALLAALDTLTGKPLVGVIGSLGVRGETRAVRPLAERLTDQDAMVAQAAARALGSIGNVRAARALSKALSGSTGDTRLAMCEGLFRCAEGLGGSQAVAIYDELRQLKAPHQVRVGALRGAILVRENDLDLLKASLKSDDYVLFSAAAQTALEMPGVRITRALGAALKGLPADNQILILGILAKRGDTAALPAISAAAMQGDKTVRIAAIEAIPPLSDASAVGTLVALMKDAEAQIAQAAQGSLAALPGSEVDRAVRVMLEEGDRDTQLQALELIDLRRMPNAASVLFKAAKDDDAAVRAASIRMLGDLRDAVQFSSLIDLLLEAQSAQEIRAAERALSATCTRDAQSGAGRITIGRAVYGAVGTGGSADVTRKVQKLVNAGAQAIEASNGNFGDPASGIAKQLQIEFTVDGVTQARTVREGESVKFVASVTPASYVNALCDAMPQATSQQKRALLRVLRVAQGPQALEAVRAAVKDADADVRAEAISILCAWSSTEALPEVLALTKTATERKVKILALRGAIRLIPLQNVSVQDKLAGFKDLLPLIQRPEEKRLLLGSLATVAAPEALALCVSYLDDAATKNEACFAVVAIAEKLPPQRNRTAITEALQKVMQISNNDGIKKRARQVLRKTRQ